MTEISTKQKLSDVYNNLKIVQKVVDFENEAEEKEIINQALEGDGLAWGQWEGNLQSKRSR